MFAEETEYQLWGLLSLDENIRVEPEVVLILSKLTPVSLAPFSFAFYATSWV
jgi:hypothetical protein